MIEARERKLQELASRLVEREVIYCVSSLIDDLAKIASNINARELDVDLDYDDLMDIMVQDNWEEPGRWFIQNDADLDDLYTIAENNGYWLEVLESCGVPETVMMVSDMICEDCHMLLQTGELHDVSEERLAELNNATNDFMSPVREYMERSDLDAEFHRPVVGCNCCGSPLAGAYFAYTDMTDESDDVDARIAATEDPDATLQKIRDAVEALVTDDDSWRTVCDDNRLDPQKREAYEQWIVTNWFARKLAERGEMTGEVMGLTIWGRCTTGQSISIDYVVHQIAAELWPEELGALE